MESVPDAVPHTDPDGFTQRDHDPGASGIRHTECISVSDAHFLVDARSYAYPEAHTDAFIADSHARLVLESHGQRCPRLVVPYL